LADWVLRLSRGDLARLLLPVRDRTALSFSYLFVRPRQLVYRVGCGGCRRCRPVLGEYQLLRCIKLDCLGPLRCDSGYRLATPL